MVISRCTSCSARAAVGSSMISTRASCARARAISIRCRLPTDRLATFWSMSRSPLSRESSSSRARAAHGLPVDGAERGLGRLPEEDVLRHRQFGKQQQFLVHRGDAGGMGVPRRGELHRPAIDQDLALVGLVKPGHDLDEGGFSRPVLAHQRMHLAGAHVEADVAHHLDAGKGLGYSRAVRWEARHALPQRQLPVRFAWRVAPLPLPPPAVAGRPRIILAACLQAA